MRTVATDAGVSVAAVSKVLRGAYGVSEALRTKVQASMQTLGYRPHTAARGMRGQTYTLGVLLPDLRNPFFADIVAGIDEALVRTQYQALLGVGQSAATTEHALVDAMIDRQIDGVILIAPRIPTEELIRIAGHIPAATIGLHLPDAPDFDTVNNDDELGGALVVRHLYEAGYRNIVYLSLDFPCRRSRDLRAPGKGLSQGNEGAWPVAADPRRARAAACPRHSGGRATFAGIPAAPAGDLLLDGLCGSGGAKRRPRTRVLRPGRRGRGRI